MCRAEMTSPLRIAIVGGGITGLAAAHRLLELQSGSPSVVTLFEAGPRLGGLVGTQQIDGYTLELLPPREPVAATTPKPN